MGWHDSCLCDCFLCKKCYTDPQRGGRFLQRNVYITDEYLSLTEYIPSIDDIDCYHCWQNEGTQNGFNFKLTEGFDKFQSEPIK